MQIDLHNCYPLVFVYMTQGSSFENKIFLWFSISVRLTISVYDSLDLILSIRHNLSEADSILWTILWQFILESCETWCFVLVFLLQSKADISAYSVQWPHSHQNDPTFTKEWGSRDPIHSKPSANTLHGLHSSIMHSFPGLILQQTIGCILSCGTCSSGIQGKFEAPTRKLAPAHGYACTASTSV